MRWFPISSVLAVVLVGSLAAQQPAPQPSLGPLIVTPVLAPTETPAITPVGATQIVNSIVLPAATGHHCESGSCEIPTKTICVPECATKKVTTTLYSSVCEPFCVPKCGLFGLFGHCDGDCASCEHPRNKRYLVIKTCTEEVPVVKCKAVTVPACGPTGCSTCGPTGCSSGTIVTGAPVASVPAMAPPAAPPIAMPK
jgi:hypothetical protein